jgi:hypothetical protein
MLSSMILVFALASWSRPVFATPVVFDFDAQPVSQFNPTFTQGGLTITFSATPPSVAQWAIGTTFSGLGAMRLSDSLSGGFFEDKASMAFSTPVNSVDLFANDFGLFPFSIAALSPTKSVLNTVSLPVLSGWMEVTFAGFGPIGGLSFDGFTNSAYWDHMTVDLPTSVPEPASVMLVTTGLVSLIARRRRKRAVH